MSSKVKIALIGLDTSHSIAFPEIIKERGDNTPLEVISWGSMLSLSEKALLSGSWWIILIPGAFLVTLLMCLTNIGNYLRKTANRKESNL